MSDIDTLREELELLGSMIDAERATPTPENRQCTDEQIERCHKLRDRIQAQQPNAEPVAWMNDVGEFVTAEVMNQWKADAGPTASYFIPRYPLPLYAHPPASTEPRLTVEQAMEVVEPFIEAEVEMEDGARWNWESKHKKYREMIEEIRDRLAKAAKQST